VPSNPYTSSDDLLPIVYARPYFLDNTNAGYNFYNTPSAYKGISGAFKFCTTTRTNLELLTVASTGDRMVVGNIAFPWNGTSPIL
jgi:hypothetical protein